MIGGTSNLLYILSDAFRSLRENLATTVLTSVTLGFSLSIFSLFLLVFMNLNGAISGWGDRAGIIAYIKDGAAEGPEALRQSILRIPGVRSAEYVSREMALKELKDGLGAGQGILEGVDANPLPASFEIKVTELYEKEGNFASVVERLEKTGWVEEVQYSREWVEKFSAFLRFVELGALVIGVFLAAATVFIISNTIRLTVYARKEEIEIMRLVGASGSFIKVPFFIEGIVQGLAGGVLALAILGAGRLFLASNIPPYFNFVIRSPLPVPLLFLALAAAGVFMGVAGSLVSMGKFLKA